MNSAVDSSAPPGLPPALRLERRGRWLVVRLPGPCRVLSWALVGGGRVTSSTVAWLEVSDQDLPPEVDARRFLVERLPEAGLPADVVAMMTSYPLRHAVEAERRRGGEAVRVVATVGLSNALAVGDPSAAARHVGTINVLCHVSSTLSEPALVEAVALVAEARTAALVDRPLPSPLSGRPCTGSGTDCVVVASAPGGTELAYCGKHTATGSLIGAAARRAIERGIDRWHRVEAALGGR